MALPNNPLESFIWGSGGAALTPEQIVRQREIAGALAQQGTDTSPVGSWTQGLARVADALGGVIKERRADSAETANTSANTGILQTMLQGGMNGFPQAPTASPGAFPSAPSADGQATASAPEGVADGIRQTAAALGIDPIDLGTAISYETAGTFDPTKRGPTTQWGQHEGLIQFGEPQRKQYGVDLSTPEMAVTSQLGPDGAVAKYLRAAGVKPGMGLLDVYSAINAGGVGKFNASDAKNGGAPGTVRDKVEQQMAAHRAKALALLGGGNQVASLDPGIGINPPAGASNPDPGMSVQPFLAMGNPDPGIVANPAQAAIAQALSGAPVQQVAAQTIAPDPVGAPVGTTPAGARVMGQMMSPEPMGGSPMPMQGGNGLPPTAAPGTIARGADGKTYQYAETTGMAGASGNQGWIETSIPAPQSGGDNLPVMAGGSSDAIPAGQVQRGINPAIIEALSNPAASEQTRKIAGMLLGQQMQSQDPAAQMAVEKQRLELEAMKHPQPKYNFMAGKDGSIFRGNETAGTIDQVYGGKPDTYRTLTPDEKVKMGLPADGAFQIGADNKVSQIGGGGTTVNIDQKTEGAFDKKMAENQATMLTDMASGGFNAKADLGVINELGGLLKNNPGGLPSGIAGWLAQRGIGGDGMSDMQAAESLINKLIPSQRQAGSGTMSDRDVDMFRASLPSLWKSPEGNQKVLQVMQGLAQYKIQQGDIATKVMNGEMTRQEASKALGALPNPLANFGNENVSGPQPGTVEDGYRFKGGDPSDRNNWEPVQ